VRSSHEERSDHKIALICPEGGVEIETAPKVPAQMTTFLIVPTPRVGTQPVTLCITNAERGSDRI